MVDLTDLTSPRQTTMAIRMEWIPKEGVLWAAKYSSSGMRRFSTFRLREENPIAHRTPPWALTTHRPLSEPVSSSFISALDQVPDTRKDRAQSAPTRHLRQTGNRPPGGRRKECFSGKQNATDTADGRGSKLWRRFSADRISSCGTTRSASRASGTEKKANGESRSPCHSSRFRARSAWGRLAKHLMPDDPEPEPPKPLWGVMVARLPFTDSSSSSPPPAPFSSSPRPTSATSNSSSESSGPTSATTQASPTKPCPPAVVSRTSSARSRPPSATRLSTETGAIHTSADQASRASSAISRPPTTTTQQPSSVRSESCLTLVEEGSPRSPPPGEPRPAWKTPTQQSDPSSPEGAVGQCPESPPEELVQDPKPPSAGKGDHCEEGEEAEEQRPLTSARSGDRLRSSSARPGTEVGDGRESAHLVDGRVSSAGTQKSWAVPVSKGDNKTSMTSQYPAFTSEIWYQKGCKLLATLKNARGKSSSGNDTEELDPEFIIQRLIRPTASSRSRQVTHWPAASYAHSSGATPQPKRKDLAVFVRPNRFKGTRSVTPNELREIVNRLSACDPAQVPDSGLSRSRGKGFGDRRSAAWADYSYRASSGRSKSRSGLYVRGFAEEFVRRSLNNNA